MKSTKKQLTDEELDGWHICRYCMNGYESCVCPEAQEEH